MGAYMPNVNIEFFELLQKHPSDFEIKAFAVDGVKLSFSTSIDVLSILVTNLILRAISLLKQ